MVADFGSGENGLGNGFCGRRPTGREAGPVVEVDYLQAVTPGEHGETEHRGDNHQIRGQCEEELVDMLEVDELLDEHLEHIGEHLQQTPGANAVRAETALEIGADLALVKDVEQGQQGIYEQQPDAHEHALEKSCTP